MLPLSPDTTKGGWTVEGGLFYWDDEPYVILTLNDKKFVYKTKSGKGGGESFTLNGSPQKWSASPTIGSP